MLGFLPVQLMAQSATAGKKKLLRVYEDNDFINFHGRASDEAYTNGTRIDLFAEAGQSAPFFADKWIPKPGSGSVNTTGWGIMQLMYTPQNTRATVPDKRDYPYAGALFLIRSLIAENYVRKLRYTTELLAGITGPYAFAGETQRTIHRLSGDIIPAGWELQVKTNLILNLDFAAEKQLWYQQGHAAISAEASIKAGSLRTEAAVYTIFRAGWLNPLFQGFINQFHSTIEKMAPEARKIQVYAQLKPGITYTLKNVLVSGGIFDKKEGQKNRDTEADARHLIYGFDYGIMISLYKVRIEVSQKIKSGELVGKKRHEVGNVTVYTLL